MSLILLINIWGFSAVSWVRSRGHLSLAKAFLHWPSPDWPSFTGLPINSLG